MGTLPDPLLQSLQRTAALETAVLFNEGKSSANDPEEWPLARISEVLDNRVCRLCAAVNGLVLQVGSAEYYRWKAPSHINCRRVLEYLHRDEGQEATFQEPDPELIAKYGHYLIDPEKHAELRFPAGSDGRNVIVRRVRNLATGEVETRLDWAPWLEQVPEWKRKLVLEARATTDPARLQDALGRLGLQDLSQPERMREATLLGLKDRLDGWVSVGLYDPAEEGEAVSTGGGGEGGIPTAKIQNLKGHAGEFWRDRATRLTDLQALVEAVDREDAAATAAALKRIDDAVTAALAAAGYPRRAPVELRAKLVGMPGEVERTPEGCRITFGITILRRNLNLRNDPETPVRTWLQESIHARRRMAADYGNEYAPYEGYEEGMAEGLALMVARAGGLSPKPNPTYAPYVRALEILAEEAGFPVERLYQRMWTHQVGRVRATFAREVAGLYQAATKRVLSASEQKELLRVADEVFETPARQGKPGRTKEYSEEEVRKLWRQVFP